MFAFRTQKVMLLDNLQTWNSTKLCEVDTSTVSCYDLHMYTVLRNQDMMLLAKC